MRQSDEGCSPDLFKTDQKKGVGYLLLIIQPSFSHDQAKNKHNNMSAQPKFFPNEWPLQQAISKIQAQASTPFGRGNSVFSPQSKVVLDFPKHSQGITPSRNSSHQSEPV